jgi:ribosomal protein L22
MTDEPETQGSEEPEAEAAEKPKRRRTRAKAKPPAEQAAPEAKAGDDPAEEKPKRTRSRAKKPAATKAKAEEPKADEPTAEKAAEAKPSAKGRAAESAAGRKKSPARKRGADAPAPAPPVVRAQAKYVRSSARKARLVCEHIRGKDVDEARAILRYTPRSVARDWSKLLESAVANAEHNHELVGDDLLVSEAFADEGPTLKRFRPRAMGRATRIRKRTSHLTIKLVPKS